MILNWQLLLPALDIYDNRHYPDINYHCGVADLYIPAGKESFVKAGKR